MRARLAIAVVLLGGCRSTFPPGWAFVTAVTTTDAVIVWTDAAERVECRDPQGRAVGAAGAARPHGLRVARVGRLRPDTAYTCRIGPARRRVHFRTAPHASGRFVFAAVGDSGDGSPEAAALARRILASRPAFVLHLGDMAYRRAKPETLDARFFRPYGRTLARVPLFPTPGNHDLARHTVYAEVFGEAGARADGALGYAFDWGAAHFVSVPYTDFTDADKPGARWLAADIARARTSPWEVVFLHEPPFFPGTKVVVRGLRENLPPIIERPPIDLLLTGHIHAYVRARPLCEAVPGASVLEIISGGGGAALDRVAADADFPRVVSATHFLRVAVSADTLDVRAVGVDGHVLDRVRRRRGSRPACRPGGWPVPREK
jgi:hypothetical protein